MVRRSMVSLIVGAFMLLAGSQALAQDATPAPAPGEGMDLTSYVWELLELQTGDMPDDPTRYTMQFMEDGRVVVGADCNTALGVYTPDASGTLTITMGAMTLVLCPEGSLSDQFVQELGQVESFAFTENGELLLIETAGGALRFQPSLVGTVWEWTGLLSGDDSTITPDDPARYTIEFLPEGMVAVGADCNRGRGGYQRDGSQVDITVDALTRAMCPPGSLSNEFVAYLNDVMAITFADGQLHMDLPMDSGILSFRPQPYEPVATPDAG
jgi:heat shock protein HslJ